MTGIRVHAIVGSPFARAVKGILLEKGVAFEAVPVLPGMTRRYPHLSLHPFGKVPVLEHGSFALYETGAILRYIERVFPDPSFTPTDPRDAARMDQIMSISDSYLYQGVNSVIGYERLVAPRVLGRPADEAAIRDALPLAHRVLGVLDGLLEHRCYLAGAVSLADLIAAPQIDALAQTPEWDALSQRVPRLVDWHARMKDRICLTAT